MRTKGSFDKIKSTGNSSAPQRTTAPLQSFAVTALDSLFLNDGTGSDEKRKHLKRGNDLLDELESLRIALLTGQIPQQDLLHLAQLLKAKEDIISDPQLRDVIREIETRVAVELAKLGMG
jgi:hypothetical protein